MQYFAESRRLRSAPAAWLLVAVVAVWPTTGLADEFINLRFYPGEEPTRENRPTRPGPITLSFTGELYQPPVKFEGGGRLAPEEEFIVRVERANREGSKEEILALWAPGERQEIAADLADPVMFTRNRQSYQGILEAAFVLKASYGPYLLFLVEHTVDQIGKRMQIYPIRQTGSGFVLTNDLADDPMFKILYDLYRERIQRLDAPQDEPSQDDSTD